MISTGSFAEEFKQFPDHACLSHFRFKKANMLILATIIYFKPADGYFTEPNRYSCHPLLACCVLLSRLATVYPWSDGEVMFCKHGLHPSEIFWESTESFVDGSEHVMTDRIHAQCIAERAEMYENSVDEKKVL